MIKSVFIFINLFGLLLYSFFNIEDIVITHTGPSEIGYGESAEVKIIINKTDFSGPGRLKLDLTEAQGIQIIEKENDGSSFTFKNNEALYIWYDLPSNKNIEITYLINPNDNILGLKKITGSFSFINNNDRKQLDVPSLIINVIEPVKISSEPSVEANRTIEGSNGEYVVKIHALKGKHKGFARIKDEIPLGYTAQSIESAGAVFKNIDGSAKFIWSDLPSSIESFTVSYKLINPTKRDTNFIITGVYASERLINEGHNSGIPIPITYYNPESDLFTYNELTNDTTTEVVIKKEEITQLNNQDSSIEKTIDSAIDLIALDTTILSQVTTENETLIQEENIIQTDSVGEENIIQEVTDFINTEETNESNVEPVLIAENTVSPQITNTKINYKVQILAAHKIANKTYIANRFKFNENYDLENHEGWIKYTTGTFMEYKGARNKRNALDKHDFPGPFVTAYNYGERISVQEALIISKQSWIP